VSKETNNDMKVDVYNAKGKASQMDVSDDVFGVAVNEGLVHQVYTALMSNARRPFAHVKDRADVRGGGRKPWRQKGTGRARHGSIRSPLWRGGGVTFGPRNTRQFKKKVNKKMNQSAVRMCLSDRAKHGQFAIVDEVSHSGKTKDMSALLAQMPGGTTSTLFISGKGDENIIRGSRNIGHVDVARAQDVNVVDLLHHQFIIAGKDSVSILEKRLA
jgi:large subunit ribosomal protein L4